jgi:hypothetical protein
MCCFCPYSLKGNVEVVSDYFVTGVCKMMQHRCVTHLCLSSQEQQAFSLKLSAHRLLAVQFHNQLLLNIFRNTFPFRISNESTFLLSLIKIYPAEFCVLTTDGTGDR